MQLIYDGPHLAVEVPHDDVPGGWIVAEKGQPVEIPDDIAAGLLEQGNSYDADGKLISSNPQWKQAKAAKASVAPADTPKDGDNA